MATLIHLSVPDADINEWSGKAVATHMKRIGTRNFRIPYRYIIAKGNIIEGIEAED